MTHILTGRMKKLIQCQSTNDIVSENTKNGTLPLGEIVYTHEQLKGRGQRGNGWESEIGKNLTFSFAISPAKLNAEKAFQISKWVSLSLYNYLIQKGIKQVSIKWPNDLYISNKKVAGILIENLVKNNEISHSIIGIGLNLNQTLFQESKATSLQLETQKTYSIEEELLELISVFNQTPSWENDNSLNTQYLNQLYRRGEIHPYKNNITDEIFLGEIIGVNPVGALQLKKENQLLTFGIKEVSFL